MHNTANTNIEIIEGNYAKLTEEQKANPSCVLLTTGSFNPIHRSHIKNLQLVKKHLEEHETSPINVLAAYISPTHDSYVRPKLGHLDSIVGEQRCQLCEAAIKEENLTDFFAVSRGEIQCPSGFVDFDRVTKQLAKFLNTELYGEEKLLQRPLTVVYVCGLDHFNKCPYVQSLAKEKNIACAVIYRSGADERRIKTLNPSTSNIYYITLDDERSTLVDISSTAIRQCLRTGNHAAIEKLSYPCIASFYTDKPPSD